MTIKPRPEPQSKLGYYRLLSPTAGVRVSPLCLGSMNFGDAWSDGLGKCDKATAFSILDHFWHSGGNFIDTANHYQDEESETWIGEWMAARGNRDQMVVATKFTSTFPPAEDLVVKANFQGNATKSLRLSVRASLRKLQTDYIDILYLHWWDFSTSIPELMHSLHHLVAAGTVFYLGVSDTPAWVVAKANEYARARGLTPFVVYQGKWSAAARDFERDILPMCQAEGMALCPWGALGSGEFKTEEQRARLEGEGRKREPSEKSKLVTKKLEQLAKTKGTEITSVALAYIRQKAPYVFPIIGGRKVEHLEGNIKALSLELTTDEIRDIEAAAPFEVGFPLDFLFESWTQAKYNSDMSTRDIFMTWSAGYIDPVGKPTAIQSSD